MTLPDETGGPVHGCLVILIGIVAIVVGLVVAAVVFPQAAPTIALVGGLGLGLPVGGYWVLALIRSR